MLLKRSVEKFGFLAIRDKKLAYFRKCTAANPK